MSLQKPKILIFTDWFLPGYKAGGTIRACANMLAWLSDQFEFYVVTRDRDYLEKQPYPDIHRNKWNVSPSGYWVYYLSPEQHSLKCLRKLIEEREYLWIYINGMYSFYYSILPLFVSGKMKKNIILAPRGMLAPGALRIKPIRKKAFLLCARLFGLYRRVKFHATGAHEAEHIESRLRTVSGTVIAPDIPANIPAKQPETIKKMPASLKIVSIARISPEKNLLFALEILSMVKGGNISFDIYGPVYDKAYWGVCREAIEKLPGNIAVKYHGSLVHEETDAVLRAHHLMFMPTLGENFGYIIAESLAAACPVLISDQTPWEDIAECSAGWALPLEEKEAFVHLIEHCLNMDQKAFGDLARAAFEYIVKRSRPRELMRSYQTLFSIT